MGVPADPASTVGHTAAVLALVAALAGTATALVGMARHRPRLVAESGIYAWLIMGGALVASATLVHAFLTHDFALSYVADNNSRQTPLLYDISGMWSALQGSILLWGLVLAGYVAVLARRLRRVADHVRAGWALVVSYLVAAFFFALMVGPANPFVTVSGPVPANGSGPNALLQDNLLVAFHPPLMYLGLVGFTVPFALAVGELVTGRTDATWLAEARRFALVSWTFLSVAIVLGMWWSYQVLGWAGYWGWDPVENGPLLVWLVSTAYLHSVLAQQRRGLLRAWNCSLILGAFTASVFTTFLTRSDVIESVHSFSQSAIGPLLLGFLAAVALGGVALIGWRADRLRLPWGIDAPISREGAFLANNALFAGFAVVILTGTVFPILLQAVDGRRATVGAPYFDTLAAPLALALVLLMAIGPVLPWRKANRGVLWHRLRWPAWVGAATLVASVLAGVRGVVPLVAFAAAAFAATSACRQLALGIRRFAWRGLLSREAGGMVVHLGIVAVVVAIVASSFYSHRGQLELAPGRTSVFAGEQVTYLGTRLVRYPDHTARVASVRLDGSDGRYHPAISTFSNNVEGVGTPAVVSNLWRNVYLTLDLAPARPGGPASIGVVVQPLLVWLWIGGAMVGVGALVALVAPERRIRPRGERHDATKGGDHLAAPEGLVASSQLLGTPPARVGRALSGAAE